MHVKAAHQDNDSDSDGYVFSVHTPTQARQKGKTPRLTVQIEGLPVSVLIDSRACKNLLPEQAFRETGLQRKCRLQKTTNKVYSLGSDEPLDVLGKFTTEVTFKGRLTAAEFLLTRNGDATLLSYMHRCHRTGPGH